MKSNQSPNYTESFFKKISHISCIYLLEYLSLCKITCSIFHSFFTVRTDLSWDYVYYLFLQFMYISIIFLFYF